MALSDRNQQFEAEMAAERAKAERKALVVAAVVGLIGAASVVMYGPDVVSGSVVGMGRVAVGLLGVAAAIALRLRPQQGYLLMMAWALVQIPVYAWSPEGSPNLQIINLPLTMTESSRVNGVLASYTSFGVNLVGIVLAATLRVFKPAH